MTGATRVGAVCENFKNKLSVRRQIPEPEARGAGQDFCPPFPLSL